MMAETKIMSIGEALDTGTRMAIDGRHDAAINLFKAVLKHEPLNFEAMVRMGTSLFETKKLHEALYWFWRAKKIAPRHPLALTNYGLCLGELGHPDEGVADLERALANAKKSPDTSPAVMALIYNNLGNILERLGRFKEALDMLAKGISINPSDPFPHYNAGICLLRLNHYPQAHVELTRAIALCPHNAASESRLNVADAYYNRGRARLLMGDLKNGFADYEYRLTTTENPAPNFGLPEAKKWTGAQDLAGKTLLLYCEQGLGDDIQFFRFLPELAKRGAAKIKMACHTATAPLLPIEVELLQHGNPPGEFDYWVALMSLPLCFGVTNEADIPPPHAPAIEAERVQSFKELADPAKLNVGICWAGNWQHKNDAHRSIAFDTFLPLLDVEGCNFVSLQQLRPEDREKFASEQANRTNLRSMPLSDFRDTAAAILNLDLVVTVDTAVAHLAASLGIPTWILLPAFNPDWRWQIQYRTTPWYPSAMLWRQNRVGNWKGVIEQVKGELAETVNACKDAA